MRLFTDTENLLVIDERNTHLIFFLSLQCRVNQEAGIYADFSCKQLGVVSVYNTPVTSVPVGGEKQF